MVAEKVLINQFKQLCSRGEFDAPPPLVFSLALSFLTLLQ